MDTQKYIYHTPARWLNGSYGPDVSEVGCTLGLTAQGRVECTLDTGKVLFSAPVALTRRRYETTYGWLRFVVGPQLYVLQFYSGRMRVPSGWTAIAQLGDAYQAKDMFQAWQKVLEQYATQPPDAEPVIAAAPPPSLVRQGRHQRRQFRDARWLLVLLFPVAGLVAGVVATKAGVSQNTGVKATIIVGAIILYPALRLFRHIAKKPAPALPGTPGTGIPADQTATAAADVLPAGTRPTAGFGFTTGQQTALGLGIGAGIIIIAIVIAAIVSAAGHATP